MKQLRSFLGVLLVVIATAGRAFGEDAEIATTFTYADAKATSVGVAGEFSNWQAVPLAKNDAGVWAKQVYLKPGYYGYKFVVNETDWVLDPANPVRKVVNDIKNSGITVGGPAATVFQFKAPDAQAVHLAGEFNNWNATTNPLAKDATGTWRTTIQLKPGKYQYKFVVDGNWQTDPAAPETAPDGLGGQNSLKVISE